MTLWLAVAGWTLVVTLAVQCARLGCRLDLVARADHELRAPVSALALAVEALGRHPELRRRAAALDAHLDRLRLGLADLAAARTGRRARPRPTGVTLEPLARAAAEAWRPAARASGREVVVDWRAGDLEAHADPARLSQALGNVLGNALEHGSGAIELRGERHDDGLLVAVTDEGPAGTAVRGSERGQRPRLSPEGGQWAFAPHDPDARRPRRRARGRGLRIAREALEHAGGSIAAVRPGGAGDGTPGRAEGGPRRTTVAIELPASEMPSD